MLEGGGDLAVGEAEPCGAEDLVFVFGFGLTLALSRASHAP
jgi:hypothetical protein